MGRPKGKVAFIRGATRGIGEATVDAYSGSRTVTATCRME